MTSIIGAAGVFMAGVATGIWLLVLLGELSERPSANNGWGRTPIRLLGLRPG